MGNVDSALRRFNSSSLPAVVLSSSKLSRSVKGEEMVIFRNPRLYSRYLPPLNPGDFYHKTKVCRSWCCCRQKKDENSLVFCRGSLIFSCPRLMKACACKAGMRVNSGRITQNIRQRATDSRRPESHPRHELRKPHAQIQILRAPRHPKASAPVSVCQWGAAQSYTSTPGVQSLAGPRQSRGLLP